jgi:hypothetical protein
MFHAVSTAGVGYLSGFDRWWRAAGGSFIGDDLAQILNAVLGKGGHAILPETVTQSRADWRLIPAFGDSQMW